MDNFGYLNDLENQKKNQIKTGRFSIENQQKIHTYNEAIEIVGIGKFHNALLFVCGLCMMSVMTEIMGISLLIPIAKCDLKFTINEQGFLASSGFLGIVISSHAMGFLSDTWGRLKVLKMSITISCICSLISIFSINVWMFSGLRFLVGFFISSCQACNFSYLGEFHCSKTRTRRIALLSTFLPLALIYMPVAASLTLPLEFEWYIFNMKMSSWRLFIFCNSIPGIIALISLPFFPESPRYLLVQGHEEEAINILKKVYVRNTGLSEDSFPVKQIIKDVQGSSLANVKTICDGFKLIWNQTLLLFTRNRRLVTLNLITQMFIIFGIAQGAFMWFPEILNKLVDNMHTSTTICQVISSNFHVKPVNSSSVQVDSIDSCEAGVDIFMYEVLIAMGVLYTIIYIIFSSIVNIVGKKNLIMSWMIVNASCALALNFSTGFYVNMVLFTLTMAVGNCAGILHTIAMEFYPTNINAMAMCLFVMVGRLGSSSGSSLIGTFLLGNCNMFFYGISALVFVLVILTSFLPVVTK